MSPDNQKLSELLMELAENDEDYVGSEVESEFAVWEKDHRLMDTGTENKKFPSPHERPPLFVRDDGTPTPGSLAPFWNEAIVLNLVDKDGPGNSIGRPKKSGKKTPLTVGVYKDQLYAFNNGAAKESSGSLSQFWYNETSVMRLIPGIEPYVTPVDQPHEATDLGTEMSITPQEEPNPKMTDPLECYLCSKYPAYLVLDYKIAPTLLAMRKTDLTAKLEDIKKKKSSFAKEKFTPLVNIRKSDVGTPDCVLYFKTGESIHFVQVDQSSRKLTVNTQSNKEEVDWRKYRDFKERTFKAVKDCTDAPGNHKESHGQSLESESKTPLTCTAATVATTTTTQSTTTKLSEAESTLEIKQQDPGEPITAVHIYSKDCSIPEPEMQHLNLQAEKQQTTLEEIDTSMHPHAQPPAGIVATDQLKPHSLTSNGVKEPNSANTVHQY